MSGPHGRLCREDSHRGRPRLLEMASGVTFPEPGLSSARDGFSVSSSSNPGGLMSAQSHRPWPKGHQVTPKARPQQEHSVLALGAAGCAVGRARPGAVRLAVPVEFLDVEPVRAGLQPSCRCPRFHRAEAFLLTVSAQAPKPQGPRRLLHITKFRGPHPI